MLSGTTGKDAFQVLHISQLCAPLAEPVSSWNRFQWGMQAAEVKHPRTGLAAQQGWLVGVLAACCTVRLVLHGAASCEESPTLYQVD